MQSVFTPVQNLQNFFTAGDVSIQGTQKNTIEEKPIALSVIPELFTTHENIFFLPLLYKTPLEIVH
jgi:hypothetical protein